MSLSDGVKLGALRVTLLAGVVGYLVNAWLERKAHALRLRTEAYTDLLRGVTGCSAYARGTDQHKEFSATHMDARARILVFGDPGVIEAVAAFWGLGAGFDSEEKQDAFVRLIGEMRRATGYDSIDSATIKTTLLDSVDVIKERQAETLAVGDGRKIPAMHRIK